MARSCETENQEHIHVFRRRSSYYSTVSSSHQQKPPYDEYDDEKLMAGELERIMIISIFILLHMHTASVKVPFLL